MAAGLANGSGLQISITDERDIVLARNAGRDLSKRLGLPPTEQVKFATAISELARNIVLYAGSGTIELRAIGEPVAAIEAIARDRGPGIPNLPEVLSGKHRSRRGMGLGLKGTQRLMDTFEVTTAEGQGTTVRVTKRLPATRPR